MAEGVEKEQQLKVFVQDPAFTWIPAKIIATDGEHLVKVQIELPPDWNKTTLDTKKTLALDKSEQWVDLNDYHDHKLPLQNSKAVRDIAELAHLHEAAILYQIKARHALQKPYTRVGEIIIAVNPCQWIDGLYSQDLQKLYAKHFVWQGTFQVSNMVKISAILRREHHCSLTCLCLFISSSRR
jgi:myosin-5